MDYKKFEERHDVLTFSRPFLQVFLYTNLKSVTILEHNFNPGSGMESAQNLPFLFNTVTFYNEL